jgi:hypothetical protein
MLRAACRVQPGGLRRSREAGLLVLASALLAANLFFLEYFIGLEILRPIFLWILLRRAGLRGRQLWQRLWAVWTPVLVVVAAFLVWRIFIFSFPTYKPVLLGSLAANPAAALVGLVKTVVRNLWTALGGAWLQTLRLPEGRRALGLGAAGAALVGLLWWRTSKAPRPSLEGAAPYWGTSMLGIGLVAMLAGGSIFWVTSIPVTLEFPWDRSTLSLMLGASLVVTGLLEIVLNPRFRPVIAAGLVALAVMMHYTNAQEYRAEWAKLQDFFWQLTWRAPQLQPGTLALFDVIPLNRYSDSDMTALLNWTYAPDLHQRQIPYKFFDLTIRLGTEYAGLSGLEPGLPVEHHHRGVSFVSTTDSVVVLQYAPPGCLKILSAEDAALPGLPDRLARALPLSRLDQIVTGGEPAAPPAQLGAEPARGWCYTFQKAELARQRGDFAAAAALGDEARQRGLKPADPAEWLPFIEAYIVNNQLDQARSLTGEVREADGLTPALCAAWQRAGELAPAAKTAAAEMRSDLGCQP